MIKVYITDDHPATTSGVKQMLHETGDIRVTGIYNSGKTLLEALQREMPDVLLLDIHLPDITGNRLARVISDKYPQIRILAFTNMQTDFHLKDMLLHGCKGYLPKTVNGNTIIDAIREVYQGGTFIQQELKPELKAEMSRDKKKAMNIPPLTKREQEVLRLICSGHSNQQIAQILFISTRTAESHRFNLLQKLNAGNVAELVKLALHAGLVD